MNGASNHHENVSPKESRALLTSGGEARMDHPATHIGNMSNNHNAFSMPLLFNRAAPLADVESEENDLDDREVVSSPYPGVDDSFFTNDKDEGSEKHPDTEVESIPSAPKEPEPLDPHIPRTGPDGDDTHNDHPHEQPDEGDGRFPLAPGGARRFPPSFPFSPDIDGFDIETGTKEDSIPDVNVYQHKKTLAQGMMDLALFSANANQLRYVLESSSRHPYFYPSMGMIIISLILQVAVGIGLIWNATYNVKNEKEICLANKINNFTVIGIFLITIVNVFISAFGVANSPTT